MHTFWKIAILIVLPLAWGIAVEQFFEHLRRRKKAAEVAQSSVRNGSEAG